MSEAEKPKQQPIVCNVVVRRGNKVLLIETASGEEDGKAKLLGFPGGRVEVGENTSLAARSEVLEESGYIVRVTGLVGVYQSKPTDYYWITNFSFSGVIIGGAARADRKETSDVGFYDIEKTSNECLRTPDMRIINEDSKKPLLPIDFILVVPTIYDRELKGESTSKLINRTQTICSVVINHQGKFVLVRETKEPYSGILSLPGGYINFEEFSHNAIKRKAAQETGLEIDLRNIIRCYQHRTAGGEWVTNICYYGESIGGELRSSGTVLEARAFSLEEIVKMSEREARVPTHDALHDLAKRQVFLLDSVKVIR